MGSEAVDGPDLRRTWQRVERTTPLVERMVQSGRLPVVGVRRASPLLETLGLDPAAADDHLTHEASKTCEYCAFDAVCGRRWEQLPW